MFGFTGYSLKKFLAFAPFVWGGLVMLVGIYMYVVLSIYMYHNKSYMLLFGPGLVSSYTVISNLTRYSQNMERDGHQN